MSTTDTTTKTTTTNSAADDHAEVQATPQQAEKFRAAFESLAAERAALAEDRLTPGCTNLGLDYANAQGVAQDEQKSVALFRKACDGGDADGCYNLGFA